MSAVLLFITGVLTGVIVGFILSKVFGRPRSAGNTGDLGLLEERLGQANEGLGKFSLQLEAQNAELKQQQLQLQEAKEAAAVSRTQLDAVTKERDGLKTSEASITAALEQVRSEKEALSKTAAEVAEKLRSQESQTKFLEQARTDLLTQFRSLVDKCLMAQEMPFSNRQKRPSVSRLQSRWNS